MPHRYRTAEVIAAPADRVFPLLIDAEVQQALLHHLGSVEASCTAEQIDAGHVRVSATTAEPAMKGVGLHRATIEMDWDLQSRSCQWIRHDHTFGDRVRASGTTRLEARPDGTCTVVEQGEIEVAIPLLGTRIARSVIETLEALAPKKAAFWQERAQR